MDAREWRFLAPITGNEYLISTSRDLVSIAFIHEAFATDDMPWTTVHTVDNTKKMLENSVTLGVYVIEAAASEQQEANAKPSQQQRQIGMARLVTDYVTMSYLTDVYIAPAHRGQGLARFLMGECVAEIMDALPNHRTSILLTIAGPKLREMYAETLGMGLVTADGFAMAMTGKPDPGRAGKLAVMDRVA